MNVMIELITKLEAAIEGSLELDADIARELFISKFREWNNVAVSEWWLHEDGMSWGCNTVDGWRHESCVKVEPYTRSLDAAMTLIPEGAWDGEIMWSFGDARIGGYVEMGLANPAWLAPGYDPEKPPHAHAAWVSSYDDQDKRGPEHIKPRPMALAMCIAALKARSSKR